VSGQQHALAALYPRERPGTHFTGGWVGPRASLDGQKISSPSEFDPGPSSPQLTTGFNILKILHNAHIVLCVCTDLGTYSIFYPIYLSLVGSFS